VNARRVLAFGLVVAALLAVAAVATHGHPLGRSTGTGPTAAFFDYVLTTVVLVAVLVVAIAVWALTGSRLQWRRPERRRWHVVTTLLMLAASFALAWLLLHSNFERRLHAQESLRLRIQPGKQGKLSQQPTSAVRSAHIRWDEVAIVAALIVALGAAAAAANGRKRRRPWPTWQQAVSVALDESLDDLRNEPDLRRAIIAAYARMEVALGVAGLPRRPSEAPLEYLSRALQSLDTSAPAVRRLTDLFEWAKFSQHTPEPGMRDDAIDALVAVRDELHRPEAAA
jgi:MFS family permease